MVEIFKLPIKSILRKKANKNYDYHYTYYSGNKECEIVISLLEDFLDVCLDVCLCNRIDNKSKSWCIKQINNTTLDKLQERINNYLEKIKWEQRFYNSWELIIKDRQHKFENANTEEDKDWFLREINTYKKYLENEDEE